MKKFLIRAFILCAIIVIIGVFFECSLQKIPNPYTFKDELIARKSAAMKTLIIGSSVADYGIFPAYLGDSAYSLAISGEWIGYNEASLMRFIDKMPHLKTVFWGISFQALWKDDTYSGIFQKDNEDSEKMKRAEQCIYRGITLGRCNPLYEVECIQNLNVSFEKWKKHYLLHQPTVRCDSLGFDYSYALSERQLSWKADWEKRVELHTVNVQKDVCREVYQLNYERMLRVARLCRERGVRLYLVVPPTHSLYYTHVGVKQLKLMYAALHGVCRECDNVSCLDYFKDNRFVDDDFYDVNHLSDVGAKKFTRILAEEID